MLSADLQQCNGQLNLLENNLKPQKYDIYLEFLKTVITVARLRHSLGVMQVMAELSVVYQLDKEEALTAGLLHDAAKDLSPQEWEAVVQKAGIKITCEQDQDYLHYLHGPVSAVLVKERLDIEDSLLLEAIASHTFYGDGQYFNHPLTWCLRFSDILEPNRNWQTVRWLRDGLSFFRKIAFSGELDMAAFYQTGWLIDWFKETGKPIHPNMHMVFKNLSRQLDLSHKDLYQY